MTITDLVDFIAENDLEDLEDFDIKDLLPDKPQLSTDHVECGQLCQICKKNYCTLYHRRGDREWEHNRHMCQACDEAQFASMIDRL